MIDKFVVFIANLTPHKDKDMATVILYSSQPTHIVESIQQGNTHYAKMAGIREKYGEAVAPIFTSAYNWFIRQAEQIITRPPEAESAIWSYRDLYNLEKHLGYQILELAVPLEQVIFFKMADWNNIINQRFLGTSEQEIKTFNEKLEKQGIDYEGDIFRKPFYPQLKQQVMKSWLNLFRYHQPIHDAIMQGQPIIEKDIQGALWQIRCEWVKQIVN